MLCGSVASIIVSCMWIDSILIYYSCACYYCWVYIHGVSWSMIVGFLIDPFIWYVLIVLVLNAIRSLLGFDVSLICCKFTRLRVWWWYMSSYWMFVFITWVQERDACWGFLGFLCKLGFMTLFWCTMMSILRSVVFDVSINLFGLVYDSYGKLGFYKTLFYTDMYAID